MEAGSGPNCPLPTVMVTRIYAPLHSNGGHAGHGSQCIHSWLAAKAFTLHLMQSRTDATMVSLAGRATIAPFAQAGKQSRTVQHTGRRWTLDTSEMTMVAGTNQVDKPSMW